MPILGLVVYHVAEGPVYLERGLTLDRSRICFKRIESQNPAQCEGDVVEPP
jgi:hypothetical protein